MPEASHCSNNADFQVYGLTKTHSDICVGESFQLLVPNIMDIYLLRRDNVFMSIEYNQLGFYPNQTSDKLINLTSYEKLEHNRASLCIIY